MKFGWQTAKSHILRDITSSEEETHPLPSQRGFASTRPRGRGLRRGRGMGRGRAGSSSQAEMSTSTCEERWNDVDVPDVTPPQPTFRPTKSPGPQLIRYKLFVDNFYTSPPLFYDLLQKRIWACGTVRTNRINSLDSKSPCGSIRWIRKDSLLFVQWRDTRDVFMCSTLHTGHAEDTVQRRVRDADGHWVLKDISIPPALKEYNQCMDIAVVNAFLLYKRITKSKGEVPMHQKAFRETLVEELAAAASSPAPSPTPRRTHHKPVYFSGHSTTGRLSYSVSASIDSESG
ncbi:hypothetical protein QQF64_036308 [Cirrhinus molitorella]|uniref:PiggyBac transposable element-derived protein domain-containing protein n=1 Tax=Cirrhinus molitorella TaxID=172907 RepID=A0ABR3NJ94_9TELE